MWQQVPHGWTPVPDQALLLQLSSTGTGSWLTPGEGCPLLGEIQQHPGPFPLGTSADFARDP